MRLLLGRRRTRFLVSDAHDKRLPTVCVIDGMPATQWMSVSLETHFGGGMGFYSAQFLAPMVAGLLMGLNMLQALAPKKNGFLPYCAKCYRKSGAVRAPFRLRSLLTFLGLIGAPIILALLVPQWTAIISGVLVIAILAVAIFGAIAGVLRTRKYNVSTCYLEGDWVHVGHCGLTFIATVEQMYATDRTNL